MHKPSNSRRNGTVYVAVLGIAMVIALMAIAAMAVQRTERHMVARQGDLESARLNALTGIEIGRLRVKQNPGWRTAFPDGVWESDVALTNGTYTVEGTDPIDGDLSNDSMEPVLLTSIGTCNSAVQKVQAMFVPEIKPLDCLSVAAVGGEIEFKAADITCDQVVASNSNVWAIASNVQCDVQAVTTIFGWAYNGTTEANMPERELPDPITVFEYYVNHGTTIEFSDIPVSKARHTITNVVLSPNANPFGAGQTNPEGIYIIDCSGHDIDIVNSRIVGTLVLLNAGARSRAKDALNWTPAIANYPALLVQGDFEIRLKQNKNLSEVADRQNYNPIGTPYAGVEDSDQADSYPTALSGLVYISGDCDWNKTGGLTGVAIVGGTLQFTANTTISYDSVYSNDPPPGFYSLILKPVSGSWQQITN